MKTDEQLYFALGLAQKAGKTASGDMAVSEALKKGMGCYAVQGAREERYESLSEPPV